MTDMVMYGLLIAQVLCGLGGVVAVVLMFRRRAKEQRDKTARRVH